MAQEKIQFYNDRKTKYTHALKITERLTRRISLLRLLVFVLAFGAVYYFARINNPGGIVLSVLVSVVIFVVLVRVHSRFLAKKKLLQAFVSINDNEASALEGNMDTFGDGLQYNAPEHYYVNDLDIFGPGSVFQFLNRTATFSGRDQLAYDLSFPSTNKKGILDAQHAIREMTGRIEWRQKFQALGIAYDEKPDDRQKIEEWSDTGAVFSSWIFKVVVVLVPMLTLFMIVMLSLGSVSIQLFLTYLVIPWGIAGAYAFKVNNRHSRVGKTSEMLTKYALLLKEMEKLQVDSGELKDLKNRIGHQRQPASVSIKRLSAILTALDNRLNFVSWAILNGLFVWDILQMIRLEAWQRKHRGDVKQWFKAVSRMDVICCLANFNFNSTHAVFPELVEGPFEIVAEAAGHPLINPDKRVDNRIDLKRGSFTIITGANMAGKSTYLRTIGVNLILAMCGAPVCAEQFRFTPVQLYTSIRTMDSLKENESYFYAELKRLKAIIDTLRSGTELFIILDEILKGTNSRDKHAGSEALLKQLLELKTTGIVATHDVLLGKLHERFPENIVNRCFEVEIKGNRLNFDYLLREGVSKNLNATILMREMGITI